MGRGAGVIFVQEKPNHGIIGININEMQEITNNTYPIILNIS
jgi:hypothetical protein